MQRLRCFFLLVDPGFIACWLVTASHLIPAEYLYNDYRNPILVNWNRSFFPLDLLVSATGIYSLFLANRGNPRRQVFALVSLLLTSVSGLQAIAYWTPARDFDLTWWLPNLFLLVYPVFFLPPTVAKSDPGQRTTNRTGVDYLRRSWATCSSLAVNRADQGSCTTRYSKDKSGRLWFTIR